MIFACSAELMRAMSLKTPLGDRPVSFACLMGNFSSVESRQGHDKHQLVPP